MVSQYFCTAYQTIYIQLLIILNAQLPTPWVFITFPMISIFTPASLPENLSCYCFFFIWATKHGNNFPKNDRNDPKTGESNFTLNTKTETLRTFVLKVFRDWGIYEVSSPPFRGGEITKISCLWQEITSIRTQHGFKNIQIHGRCLFRLNEGQEARLESAAKNKELWYRV